MAACFPAPSRSRAERLGGLAVAVALHVAAVWGLLQFESVRRSLIEAAPIMVNFITPPAAEAPPKPAPAAPRPAPRPLAPPPLVTTQAAESPSPIVVPPPPPKPAPPPVEAPPAPAPVVPPGFGAAYLNNPAPAYPPLSRRLGEEGKVLLRVLVSAEGAAETVEVQASSGSPRLDRAAAEAVRAWRFVPARQAGKAVAAWVVVPIRFSLEN